MEASINMEAPSNSDRNGKHVIFLFSKMLTPDIRCLRKYDRNPPCVSTSLWPQYESVLSH